MSMISTLFIFLAHFHTVPRVEFFSWIGGDIQQTQKLLTFGRSTVLSLEFVCQFRTLHQTESLNEASPSRNWFFRLEKTSNDPHQLDLCSVALDTVEHFLRQFQRLSQLQRDLAYIHKLIDNDSFVLRTQRAICACRE